MPLVDMSCRCGNTWEALDSFSTKDPDLERCPKCGEINPKRLPGVGTFQPGINVQDITEGDLRAHLRVKEYYQSEEFSKKVLSGEMDIKVQGPSELRPVCPESLRKKYY